jgi:hypothetical protein
MAHEFAKKGHAVFMAGRINSNKSIFYFKIKWQQLFQK